MIESKPKQEIWGYPEPRLLPEVGTRILSRNWTLVVTHLDLSETTLTAKLFQTFEEGQEFLEGRTFTDLYEAKAVHLNGPRTED